MYKYINSQLCPGEDMDLFWSNAENFINRKISLNDLIVKYLPHVFCTLIPDK